MNYEEFKTFSQQFKECREDGNAFNEKTWCCGRELIMCKRFAGQCSAHKCRPWRLKNTDGITAEDLGEGC